MIPPRVFTIVGVLLVVAGGLGAGWALFWGTGLGPLPSDFGYRIFISSGPLAVVGLGVAVVAAGELLAARRP